MTQKLDYFIKTDHGVKTIWIQNHAHKKAWFQSNDDSLIAERIKGLQEDMTMHGRHEALIAMYQFAKNHGLTILNKTTGSTATGQLVIRPDGHSFKLVLIRGKQEIILKRDSMPIVAASFKKLMYIKNHTNGNILNETWDYAMAKHKLNVEETVQ